MPTRTLDAEAEPAPHQFAELGDGAGDVEAGLNRPLDVVLVGLRMAEKGQQPVALRRTDVALVLPDESQHVVAITADHRAVDLGLDPGGQCRGVDEIGEHDCQTTDFAVLGRRGQQVLGFGVALIECEHLFGQHIGGGAVTRVDGLESLVQQFVDVWRSAHDSGGSVVSGIAIEIGKVRTLFGRTSGFGPVSVAVTSPSYIPLGRPAVLMTRVKSVWLAARMKPGGSKVTSALISGPPLVRLSVATASVASLAFLASSAMVIGRLMTGLA